MLGTAIKPLWRSSVCVQKEGCWWRKHYQREDAENNEKAEYDQKKRAKEEEKAEREAKFDEEKVEFELVMGIFSRLNAEEAWDGDGVSLRNFRVAWMRWRRSLSRSGLSTRHSTGPYRVAGNVCGYGGKTILWKPEVVIVCSEEFNGENVEFLLSFF